MKTVWNVELLKTSENKYTIYFLSVEGSYQKIINNKHKLYELCNNLHEVDRTYWEVEADGKLPPIELDNEEKLEALLNSK